MALGNPKGNIQLFVTRRCQLRCAYCPVRKADADMSPRTARLGVDFLMRHRSPRLRLDFGGGEPLLNFPVVREAADYAARRARALGKDLSFYMVTNAVALDDEALDWLVRRRVLLELSLDGRRPDHNRHKPALEPGLDPYAATRRGLERALAAGADFFVIAVASPADVRRLADNFEHLYSLGARSFDLSYALGSCWGREDQEAFFDQAGRIIRRHRRALARGELRLGNLSQRNEPTVLSSELMVDTDGSLHLLSEWMFESSGPSRPAPYQWGKVQDGTDINAVYWSRFHCYYTLVRMYEDQPAVRRAVLNNIDFGRRVGRFFAALGEEVHGRA
ncbi:MAG: radical SAM protein [Elusimicrobia bacterium]|nr:radical SAM protein [Elusimicrobiota bacterium]